MPGDNPAAYHVDEPPAPTLYEDPYGIDSANDEEPLPPDVSRPVHSNGRGHWVSSTIIDIEEVPETPGRRMPPAHGAGKARAVRNYSDTHPTRLHAAGEPLPTSAGRRLPGHGGNASALRNQGSKGQSRAGNSNRHSKASLRHTPLHTHTQAAAPRCFKMDNASLWAEDMRHIHTASYARARWRACFIRRAVIPLCQNRHGAGDGRRCWKSR